MIGFVSPLWLLALPLAAVPLVLPLLVARAQPALEGGPPGGAWLEALLRLLGALAVAGLVVGLAGPYAGGGTQARIGTGAHLVLLIDRSMSMNDSFAGRRPDGSNEAKAAAAKRLLAEFAASRPHDRIAVAAFSTAPMLILPMTDSRDAVAAAIAAIDEPGLSKTDVGRGLALAFSLFDDTAENASRAVIMVSDGAGIIPREVQDMLTAEAVRQGARLYWLYLRTANSRGLFDKPSPGEPDTAQARPERHLNLFLERLGIPYRAFEAENPEAVARAIAEIDRLEARPLLYREPVPRRDLTRFAWAVAFAATALLTLARLLERAERPRPVGPYILEPGEERR
ncbi:von Willebrand factor A [Haematobacter missouriensis]|uniref:VWA domain-containing protein n=1 Tax=Haematobacter missouriensis TaxID=366616 RepID=A0A212AN21_9RHOB|nr:vWA domain-containing protein [Haematobacter missouriensis]KFI26548.1 von Willebrand factor A [Haematobacter missouriensis]OWJ72885.1 VWA domain-containing protein [Haematobacter missouriensis]OWJ82891.1 VWA domain-containing protein [Haematobacter missouriensis]